MLIDGARKGPRAAATAAKVRRRPYGKAAMAAPTCQFSVWFAPLCLQGKPSFGPEGWRRKRNWKQTCSASAALVLWGREKNGSNPPKTPILDQRLALDQPTANGAK